MTEEQAIADALEAGRAAAAVKEYAQFDTSNEESWTTYTKHIRSAMQAALGVYIDFVPYTDTDRETIPQIIETEQFDIGIMDKRTRKIAGKATVKFEKVDFT